MTESQRLPPIPDEVTSTTPDPTTKITQKPDGTIQVHSVRNGVESHLDFKSDGSYKVTSNTGTTVNFSSNNQLEYIKGGITITVDNHCDIKITGSHRVNIDTDAHIEIAKNASIAINGETEIYSTGHLKLIGADIYIGSTTGSVVINGARDVEVTASQGRMTHHSTGVQTFTTTSGDFHVASAGMVDINSGLDSTINSQGKIATTSQSTTTLNASGDVVTQGATTKLQGGGVASPPITVS